MERQNTHHEQEHLIDIIELARAVFELARQTPTSDKKQLELVRHATLHLKALLDTHQSMLDPELGQDINEYVLFKLTDDGTDPTGWTKGYEESTQQRLQEITARLDPNHSYYCMS